MINNDGPIKEYSEISFFKKKKKYHKDYDEVNDEYFYSNTKKVKPVNKDFVPKYWKEIYSLKVDNNIYEPTNFSMHIMGRNSKGEATGFLTLYYSIPMNEGVSFQSIINMNGKRFYLADYTQQYFAGSNKIIDIKYIEY